MRPADRRQDRPDAVVRVITVDDQPLSTRGLQLLLEDVADVDLAAVADSIARLDGQALDAQVALLELTLRDGSRPRDNVTALCERGLSVLLHTEVNDVHLLAEALEAGAVGIVCKHHSEAQLLDGIRQAARGQRVMPADVAQLLEAGRTQRPRLSAREVQVLTLLYEGLITKQAARRLNVSESTVKEHLKRIRQKYSTLGRPVSTRVQLLQVAHRDGFIDPPETPEPAGA